MLKKIIMALFIMTTTAMADFNLIVPQKPSEIMTIPPVTRSRSKNVDRQADFTCIIDQSKCQIIHASVYRVATIKKK